MKKGQQIEIKCYTGIGSGGKAIITKIKKKFNEETGKPYKIICCGTHEFKADTGEAITPPYMYYITGEKV